MILLVENDTISRNAFARLLRAQGHQVVEVTDGQEALELLPKDNFDLVIADLVMPRVNGFELAAQIRRHWPIMPILLMSAYLSQDGAKIISGGVAEFIQKPIDPGVNRNRSTTPPEAYSSVNCRGFIDSQAIQTKPTIRSLAFF